MPPEFLPPDPYASAPRPRDRRTTVALALGSAGLALLVLSYGALAAITLPLSIAACFVGNAARRQGGRADQATVAFLLGGVGAVLAVVALVLWGVFASSS